MSTPDLVHRHRVAVLLHELTRPASAAVIAQLPPRPGRQAAAEDVQLASGLELTVFWSTVARLESLGVVLREGRMMSRDDAALTATTSGLVADGPLAHTLEQHPRLSPFLRLGRVVREPIEPVLVEELVRVLAGLFEPGEELDETEVNARITPVHDDPAQVRRSLVDRGLLVRSPGSGRYRVPEGGRNS